MPFVGVERSQQCRQLFQSIGGIADHRVGRVHGARMILQLAYGIDEPPVVRAALFGRLGRVESTARMLLMLGCHQDTVLNDRFSGAG
jgi:hypothetical protein